MLCLFLNINYMEKNKEPHKYLGLYNVDNQGRFYRIGPNGTISRPITTVGDDDHIVYQGPESEQYKKLRMEYANLATGGDKTNPQTNRRLFELENLLFDSELLRQIRSRKSK